MENKKKSKSKILIMLFAIILLVVGGSFAIWHYSYSGTEENVLSSPDLSFRFLESNNEIVSIDNAVPMSDEDGIKQEGTGNVFDFEVKSKVGATTDIKYIASLEKISVDSGKTALNDSDVKVYIEDFNGNTVLKPTKISELNSYKLFEKLHRHSKDNSEISTKYKLKVWLDSEVDVFSLENKQYKFKINVKTEQKEQDRNQSYKLVYDLDGGTGSISDSTFKVGESVTITSVVPTKEGYNFLGWSTKKNDSSVKYKAGDSVTLNDAYDRSVRLYAVWQCKTYTVKYDNNGGNGTISDSTYKLGESKKLTKNTFTKEGYTFIGWNTNKNASAALYTDEQVVSDLGQTGETVTLYAIWKANTYTVKYDGNGGTGSMANVTYSYGESKKLTKNTFTKEGYTFVGWNTNKDASTSLYTDEQEVSNLSKENDGVITLYAMWEVKKYDVSVVVQNGTVDVANKQVVEKQNGVFNLTPSDSKYKDASVSCTNNQTGTFKDNVLTVSNVTSDTTCTVKFDSVSTVLYSDGTLIINEKLSNRNSNIATHGEIWEEYEPFSNSNSYVMAYADDQPWFEAQNDITGAQIDQKIKPTSTANWFSNLQYTETINVSNLDTSQVTTFEYMFEKTGYKVTNFNLDLSSWDTSKVTNMSKMFYLAGNSATTFNLDLSKWDTSSVTDMDSMFAYAGESATTWNIEGISNFDTTKVTAMSFMFASAGLHVATFNLDLSNWNTSSLVYAEKMFTFAGYDAKTWIIEGLSNWNTSKLESAEKMFYSAGYSATTFDLDLSNWDTSQVTNMDGMFNRAGYSATTFDLDLSNWDTSQVTSMIYMFNGAGYSATTWSVTIPKTTGSLANTTLKWYGSSNSIYAEPPSGKSFTLAT